MVKILEKVVKNAVTENKYKSGAKEVLQSMKGSKLVIMSTSLGLDERLKLEKQANSFNIPIYRFEGNSVQLGKLCNKPFRISIISIKSGSNEEITSIISTPKKNLTTNTS